MAFRAGGPHAQDRGPEAVAYAGSEQKRHASTARWIEPRRKGEPEVLDKKFTAVGRPRSQGRPARPGPTH